MPTYDYRCEGCGHGFELFQSIKAEPVKLCPGCGEEKARRVIGAGAGLIFKGSGFYITDYTRSKDYKDKTKSESGSTSSTSTSTSASPGKGAGSSGASASGAAA